MSLDLSIVIPAYNRVQPLRYTLESVRRAICGLDAEIIVVDDGSEEPLEGRLSDFADLPIRFLRQLNQGSLIAKCNGCRAAQGKYLLILDSDDLVHQDKFSAQISKMEAESADVSYTDHASAALHGDYDSLVIERQEQLEAVSSAVKLFLIVQPLPHGPIYRRSYFERYLTKPLIPERAVFNAVGDVWFYYNLAIHPAKIVKVDGYYTIAGSHDQSRITGHWESLGTASLALMLAFMKNCPRSDQTLEARRQVGVNAFISWRKLPRNFHPLFEDSMLQIWRQAPEAPLSKLGAAKFRLLARLMGTLNAARLLRRVQRPRYGEIRTLETGQLETMMGELSEWLP